MIRRWVERRARAAHSDWLAARAAYHALVGTPSEESARQYLDRTADRYHRWDVVAAIVGCGR